MKKAILVLEDGTIFEGSSFGMEGDVIGEIVFNTGMTGYQEILTDPSYCGQIVNMTYPLIGNYGVNIDDFESSKPQVKGFIVRELCKSPSNWRSAETLDHYLKKNHIIGIEGIDTRALTRILRDNGTMNGMISTDVESDVNKKIEQIKAFTINNPVNEVTCKAPYELKGDGFKVAVIDLGAKLNIVRSLSARGCNVHVFPAHTGAKEIMEIQPDGIMLTNGPGNPKDCESIIENIKILIDSGIPIFGICLGHQLIALAHGADTERLKYGHRGCNHPVKDVTKDLTYITSQNHGYTIIESSLNKELAEVSHINMNDGTIEGVRYKNKPVFTVQFHPEASPGPKDTAYLFDEFIQAMTRYREEKA
ncbi:carbamoyl phosphate synthase small subunit [Petroclostridium sp. X23]|uniref:carbamoyl phosphate synthase small subunit n=1 Tax=Petroclostridium sp. X23 TaxID=3045146 RepID=UPI0024AE2CFE|nr:carbamoyl phosphate synthase small subunit [Petroclostridium sp. X23]WHH59537.1 carbamoyl phosphate synthase small subunit [Petroclostridium sp. X23]